MTTGSTLAPKRPGSRPPRGEGGIDPRIKERRAEVLRAQARRRLRIVLAVAAVVALAGGGWGMLQTKLFSARVITVVGAVHTPPASIVAAAGLDGHPPLIDVSSSAAGSIEQLPWVASATVSRQWPDGVRITVVERVPVAAVSFTPAAGSTTTSGATAPASPTEWALVDKTGRVLADTTSLPAGLVQVSVPDAPGAAGSRLQGASPALQVATTLPAAFRGQVTEVIEHSADDLTLQLNSPVTVELGSTMDLHHKYEDVAAILAGAQLQSGDVIDVTAPGAPVVAP